MGLEVVNSNSTPNALNKDWPEGPVDHSVYGAIHLRNIKLVLKNFYNAFVSWKNQFALNFEAGKAKKALDTDRLAGALPEFFLEVFNWTKNPPVEKLPLATNNLDYGVTFLSDRTDSLLENRAASTTAVEELYRIGKEHVEGSEFVLWREAILDNPTYLSQPALMKAYLEAGHDIEFAMLFSFEGDLETPEALKILEKDILRSDLWKSPAPGTSNYASQFRGNSIKAINSSGDKLPWTYYSGKNLGGAGIPTAPEFFHFLNKCLKFTWRPLPKY